MQQQKRSGDSTPLDMTARIKCERKQPTNAYQYPNFHSLAEDQYEEDLADIACAVGIVSTIAQLAEEMQYKVRYYEDQFREHFEMEAKNRDFIVFMRYEDGTYLLETTSKKTGDTCFEHSCPVHQLDLGMIIRQLLYCAWMVDQNDEE